MRSLAVLGGEPSFPGGLPFFRPVVPALDRVMAALEGSWRRGTLTNGPLVSRLEEKMAARLGVRHVVAVSSCTSGLMLVFRALGSSRPVVLPSFTFSASAHAVAWNGARPVFAECRPDTFQLDLDDAARRLAETGAGAVLAVHLFGAPCSPAEVDELAGRAGVPVVFDAAHALGATSAGRRVGGYGLAEVFSLSPTKPLVAGEGGLVSTDDDGLADAVRCGRDYANPGDYNTRFAGLNARMSELHAAVALESLVGLDANLRRRRQLARLYGAGLGPIPGVAMQVIDPADRSTYKDLTIAVDAAVLGLSRDVVVEALRLEGIDTRRYFWPPVHRHHAYAGAPGSAVPDLPVTDAVAGSVISLPLYPALDEADVEVVVDVLACLHARAGEVSAAWQRRDAPGPAPAVPAV